MDQAAAAAAPNQEQSQRPRAPSFSLSNHWSLIKLVGQILALGLVFMFWIIALGGVGASQRACHDSSYSSITCERLFRLEWFQLFFELIILILFSLAIVLSNFSLGIILDGSRNLFVSMFLILCVLSMISADQAISWEDITDESESRARAAGWVLLSIANLVIIILLEIIPFRYNARTQEAGDNDLEAVQTRQEGMHPPASTRAPNVQSNV